MVAEEFTFSLNVPLIGILLTISGLILGAMYQLRSAAQDRKRNEEKKDEDAKKDRDEMKLAIKESMLDNSKNLVQHFDDKLRLMQKDIDDHKEDIAEHKKSLESLIHEVLEIIKSGSAGAVRRIEALEQRIKSIEDKLNKS